MTNRSQNLALAAILLLLSATWLWLVIATIPPGFGDGDIGARAFPLTFGFLLGVLAVILLVQSVVQAPRIKEDESTMTTATDWSGFMAALKVVAVIVIYGAMLEKIGFVLATPLVVALAMFVGLRRPAVRTVVLMAVGLTVGCWLIFEKLLGIYLANGTWINIG